jgi:hypothetical protein
MVRRECSAGGQHGTQGAMDGVEEAHGCALPRMTQITSSSSSLLDHLLNSRMQDNSAQINFALIGMRDSNSP